MPPISSFSEGWKQPKVQEISSSRSLTSPVRGGKSGFGPQSVPARGGKREQSEPPIRGGYREKGEPPKNTSKGPGHLGWSSPKIPDGKSAISTKDATSKQAKTYQFSKGAVNVSKNEKSKDGQKGEPSTTFSNSPPNSQPSPQESLRLENVIPAPSEEKLAPSIEEWRGFRRPKNQASSTKWEESTTWKSRSDWQKDQSH